MNNQFFQQAEQFFKPISEMMALNARTLEALAEKQTGLVSAMWNDSMSCARSMADSRDVASFLSTQNNFWEGMNQKFSSTARDSYTLLTEAQEEMGKLVQDSISAVDMQSVTQPFMSAAYQAQDAAQSATNTAQNTARSAAENAAEASSRTAQAAQKAQSQTAKTAGKAAGK
jgi:phasin family protein